MSTFLQLCADVRRECRIPGTGPTSVIGQVGQLERVVNWVKNVWTDLQNEQPNWRWMRSEFSLQTVASTDSYAYNAAGMTDSIDSAAISRFARWWDEEFQIYLTSAGVGTRHAVPYVRWEMWRAIWLTGNIAASYPSQVSIDPRNKLRLGAKPDAIYTLTGEYQKSAQTLAADGDIPEMPVQYHQIIVARAMKRYAASNAAPEVWAAAQDVEAPLSDALYADQIPEPRFGPALA